ncbi:protein-export chaperone SecB [Sporosarcina limicola]|uniref:Preprotein translocase subunit SecB n=1 Tax=Sporosarcina limicola TaxID=34101 RepID=A0A927MLZ8_9BACL|nr:protein-export chaperone SecB [Sporosarcina limicola]MBE1556431.1 preprotein translocase subunit SecB [Sporosarcina limicola]
MELNSKKYQDLINDIDIDEIILRNLAVNNPSELLQENIQISTEHSISDYRREGDLFKVLTEFVVNGTGSSQDIFSIHFTLEVVYKLDKQYNFENQYFDLFTQNNVPVNVWPFARELVSNLTMRMGLPPLLLPVLRVK